MSTLFRRNRADVLACLMVPLLSANVRESTAEITVTTDFEGGSATVVEQDDSRQFLHIQPLVRPGGGFPCWWFLRVDGLQPSQTVTLQVSGNPQPFAGQRVLERSWSLPDRAAISTDNETWKQTPKGRRTDTSMVYEFPAPAETVWLAWGPPFLPSHAEQLLQTAQKMLPSAEVFELARTRGNRPVKGIRFGAEPNEERQPFGVWIHARQHAWEAGSSWVGQGFLLWAVSDQESAVQLRTMATIHFVPIMDIDSTAIGAGGKDANPRDHNRDWDDQPFYPEVAAAQQRILELHRAGRFDVYVDLHNPGPNDRTPFFFGPIEMDKRPRIQQRNHARWIAFAHANIDQLQEKYRVATYVKTEEERNRVSSNWVRNHTAPHVMSATLETAWNRPEGTQEGYLAVGKQLGLTLLRYLEADPRGE
jgi:murein tripeptide amidase MpaA